MTLTNAIKLIFFSFFLFLYNQTYSQKIKKETLYILFKKNDGKQPEFKGKKFINSHGLNFNLIKKGTFIHKKGMKRDTLCVSELKKYKLTDENDIEKKADLWRKKNEKQLKKEYGKLYRQAFEYKNNIFNTYLIEKISPKKIVIYEVKFRNEGVIE
jgi:hypothetical protein